MGYSWYRTDSAYHRHPKMLALKAELQQPLADAYVSRLWSWTQVYAQSGRFPVGLATALEADIGWTGSSGSLAAALEKTGWLDRVGDDFMVHDWPEYQGYLVKKAKKDADTKRKRRARDAARTAQSVRADGAAPSLRTAPPTDGRDGRTDVTDDLFAGDKPPPRVPPKAAKKSSPDAPDPRLQPLREKLCAVFKDHEGTDYPFDFGRELKVLQKLLNRKPPEASPDLWPLTLAGAWGRALVATHPDCKTLVRFEEQLPRHLASGGKAGAPSFAATPSAVTCAACGALAAADIGEGVPGCYPCVSEFQVWCEATGQPEPWKVAKRWAEQQRGDRRAAS